MPTNTRKFDVQNYLKSPEDRASYLDAALEEGDPALISAALGDIAKAEGMTSVAKSTGLTREGLYKALSKDGDPRLSTLLGVTRALGIRLTAARHVRTGKTGPAKRRSQPKAVSAR